MSFQSNGTARGAAARLSVVFPTADAHALLSAATLAENYGIDQLWVGDPEGNEARVSDDRYVLMAIAAMAARTRHLRFGAFLKKLPRLDLPLAPAEMLHTVEDLAIVDQLSNGRLDAGFIAGNSGWIEHLEHALSLWTDGWDLGDGRILPLTPVPAQPILPCVLVGADLDSARRLGAGRVVNPGERGGEGARDRTILRKHVETSVVKWLEADPVGTLRSLREEFKAVRATEVMVALDANNIEEDLRALGTVVMSTMHCAPDDAAKLALDGWTWFREGAITWQEPKEMAQTSDAFLMQR